MMSTMIFTNARIWTPEKGEGPLGSYAFQKGVLLSEIPVATAETQTIDAKGQLLIPSLIELSADFKIPGGENVYSLSDGIQAARAGGYSTVVLEPNTSPVLAQSTLLDFYYRYRDDEGTAKRPYAYSAESLQGHFPGRVELRVLAAFSEDLHHQKLTDMYDMLQHGALGFSDGSVPGWTSGFLRSVLAYASQFKRRVFLTPWNSSLMGKTSVHEGAVADTLGLSGIPVFAETIKVLEILELAKATQCPVHIRSITHPESLKAIENYRRYGVDVTCDIDLHNLCFNDQVLFELDSHYNLLYPLRDQNALEGLLLALESTAVQGISTHHTPVLPQDKQVNFDDSLPGAVALEVALSAFNTYIASKNTKGFYSYYRYFNEGPRQVLGIPDYRQWLLWNPEAQWTVESKHFKGGVYNSPFLGKLLQGKVTGVYFNGEWESFKD